MEVGHDQPFAPLAFSVVEAAEKQMETSMRNYSVRKQVLVPVEQVFGDHIYVNAIENRKMRLVFEAM